ncbi:hypothetical protein JAAARDRAFT_36859, partial [Jaapia argillacea MUCL 33604]
MYMQDLQVDIVGLVQHLQLLRLLQLSATFATIYDHLITLDQEVELIWKRPGISAKIFFLLTRYCGDGVIVAILILLLTEATSDNSCHGRFLLQIWGTTIPTFVVQVIMQFRVYALYNRAKWVLALTFTCFVVQMATSLAVFAKYQEVHVIAIKLGIWTNCVVTNFPSNVVGTWIAMMVFEGILFFLALYKTLLHLLRLNHPWTRNGAVEVLVRDNILYFLMFVYPIRLLLIQLIPQFPVSSRFIVSRSLPGLLYL